MSAGQWWWTGPTFCWLTALEDAQQVVHGHSMYHHLLREGLSWQNPWAGTGSLPGTQCCCVRSPAPAHSPRGVFLYQGTRPSGRSHHAAALIKRQHSRSSCPSAWGSVIQAMALLHRDVISSLDIVIVSCFHLPVIIFCVHFLDSSSLVHTLSGYPSPWWDLPCSRLMPTLFPMWRKKVYPFSLWTAGSAVCKDLEWRWQHVPRRNPATLVTSGYKSPWGLWPRPWGCALHLAVVLKLRKTWHGLSIFFTL